MPVTVARRGEIYVEFVRLQVETCPECGVAFAAPEHLLNERRFDGRTFYCPSGHRMSYDSTRSRLEQSVRYAREDRDRARAARDRAEASARAYKGVATRTRNRAKAGVCPCCNRTFKQLAAHMKTRHPDFDPDAV